jgi:hypothetical protein
LLGPYDDISTDTGCARNTIQIGCHLLALIAIRISTLFEYDSSIYYGDERTEEKAARRSHRWNHRVRYNYQEYWRDSTSTCSSQECNGNIDHTTGKCKSEMSGDATGLDLTQ